MRYLPILGLVAAIPLTLVAAAMATAAAPAPSANALLGKRLFMRCAACHSIAPGAPAKIGPNLNGVAGRRSGAVPGFRYSVPMTRANLVWNDANLDRWIQRPMGVVPGTSMAFAGVANPAERQAIIAYLKHPTP